MAVAEPVPEATSEPWRAPVAGRVGGLPGLVVALQVVGIALMMAMLVTPAAAASLLTRRLLPMMFIAAVLGMTSSVVGLYGSYYLDIASGPAIVLVATLVFVSVFLFEPKRGVVWRKN